MKRRLTPLLFSLTMFFPCVTAFAQNASYWRTTELCRSCTPIALVPGDSSHAVVLTRQGTKTISHFTSDKGVTWDTMQFPGWNFEIVDYTFSSFIPPSNYYLFDRGAVIYTLYADQNPPQTPWEYGAVMQSTKTGKMFTPQFGYWYVGSELRRTDFGPYAGTFTSRAGSWPGGQISLEYIDSVRFIRTLMSDVLLSNDAGATWEALTPRIGTVASFHYTQPTRDRDRFYVIGGVDSTADYVYTSDAGETWRHLKGVTNGRVLRLAEQDTDRIWLLVAAIGGIPPKPDLTKLGDRADTLYYTTDGGDTWSKDLTFVGRNVIDIKFMSSSSGYVLSGGGGTVSFSQWSSASADVQSRVAVNKQDLVIHPNPVHDRLTFTTPLYGSCQARVYNLLGTEVFRDELIVEAGREASLSLPASFVNGYYLLEIQNQQSRLIQGFIRKK